ncbi:MAG: hypothetical protein DSY40_04355 [Nautilia sp.]|nr:MAG: hypothetical protein DSY40_04355 [Nautilia sp.]
MKQLFFILIGLFIIGCGYKPTITYTAPVLGNKIKSDVEIDVKNPEDSIYLKDALNEVVVNDYNANIVNKNYSSKIRLKVNSSTISAIGYDKNGYPILYRANATITAYVKDKKGIISTYRGNGNYDFAITSNSILDDNTKHNAIKEAFIQALQIIEFKIAAKEISNQNRDSNNLEGTKNDNNKSN